MKIIPADKFEKRYRETKVIERLLSGPPAVLSTGGGAWMSEANRTLLAERAAVVWLDADSNRLAFDFANPKFIERFAELGTNYAKVLDRMKINSNRGSRHFIYMNRTFFGLYNLLNMLGADKVRISKQPA